MCGTSLIFPTGLTALEVNWQIPHHSTASQMSSLISGQIHSPWLSAYISPYPGVLHGFVPHHSTASQMSSLISGQNTLSLAFSIHFSIPWCPSWICSNIFHLSVEGMRSLEPLVTSQSLTDRSSQKFQYG